MVTGLDMGMKCIKYMLFTVNVVFVITAALIISVGTTIYAIYYDFDHFIRDGFYSPANLLIAIGAIMLIISIFGCLGAYRESTAMINVFALLLSIVFILDISASIASYSLQNGLVEMVNGKLHFAFKYYHDGGEPAEALDFVQSRLACCGIASPYDWAPDYTTNKPDIGNATNFPTINYPTANTTDYPSASSTDSAPNTIYTTPSSTDSAPNTTYTMPSSTDSAPNTTDPAPNTTYTTPSSTDSAPNTTYTMPSSTDSAPNTTDPPANTTDSTENGITEFQQVNRMIDYLSVGSFLKTETLKVPESLLRTQTETPKVPGSCCPTYKHSNINWACNLEESYQSGCMKKLTYVISQSSFLLGTGALTIAFIQFVGIIFAVMLAKAIRQAKSDRERRKWEIRERIINNAYTQMEQMETRQTPKPDNPAPVIYVAHTGHSFS